MIELLFYAKFEIGELNKELTPEPWTYLYVHSPCPEASCPEHTD